MATAAVGLTWGFYLGANKVLEVTDAKMIVNGKTLDATSVDSNGWEECIAGLRSGQFTLNGLMIVTDTTGFIALQTAAFAGTAIAAKLRSAAGGYNWSASTIFTSMTVSMDLTKPQQVSWALKTTGVITPAAS